MGQSHSKTTIVGGISVVGRGWWLVDRRGYQSLENGLVQRHVIKMRRIYRERPKTLAAALRTQLGDFLTFRESGGGTAIWVRTRLAGTMTGWAEAAQPAGIAFDASACSLIEIATGVRWWLAKMRGLPR
jgi:hypothetical protein